MDRTRGIGGTDISAIVGLNPWRTPLDVFLEKTGQKEDQPDNENLYWGRAMEPAIQKRYEEETGLKVYPGKPMQHPKMSWYVGTPDGLCATPPVISPNGGVDYKTSGKPDEWGEPGTDEIPEQYIIQAEWYMGLTGAEWWDVAVLLMGFSRKFAIYRVNRDCDLIENLMAAGERFWTDHVLTGKPPALDGSKSATEYLKKKYPSDCGPMLEPTDTEILAITEQYKYARNNAKNFEEAAEFYANRLRDFIGDAAGMQGPWGKITWRKTKDGLKIDWQTMAQSFLSGVSPEREAMIIDKYTVTKPGYRRWLPKFKGE